MLRFGGCLSKQFLAGQRGWKMEGSRGVQKVPEEPNHTLTNDGHHSTPKQFPADSHTKTTLKHPKINSATPIDKSISEDISTQELTDGASGLKDIINKVATKTKGDANLDKERV
uniref:Uncharacterized protein n=1 Tax=Rhabditophanes sp. KR3021 TaxID=114890 RepID=A0AC35UB29_9BILA